jgi:hypothetical protein
LGVSGPTRSILLILVIADPNDNQVERNANHLGFLEMD